MFPPDKRLGSDNFRRHQIDLRLVEQEKLTFAEAAAHFPLETAGPGLLAGGLGIMEPPAPATDLLGLIECKLGRLNLRLPVPDPGRMATDPQTCGRFDLDIIDLKRQVDQIKQFGREPASEVADTGGFCDTENVPTEPSHETGTASFQGQPVTGSLQKSIAHFPPECGIQDRKPVQVEHKHTKRSPHLIDAFNQFAAVQQAGQIIELRKMADLLFVEVPGGHVPDGHAADKNRLRGRITVMMFGRRQGDDRFEMAIFAFAGCLKLEIPGMNTFRRGGKFRHQRFNSTDHGGRHEVSNHLTGRRTLRQIQQHRG